MIKDYSKLQIPETDSIFIRNKYILLYLIFSVYNIVFSKEKAHKYCEYLDFLNESSFIKMIKSETYRSVYQIKTNLISRVIQQSNKVVQNDATDFADSESVATISVCNSILQFIGNF